MVSPFKGVFPDYIETLIMKTAIARIIISLCVFFSFLSVSFAQGEAFYNLYAQDGTEWSIGMRSSVSPPWNVDEIFYLKLSGSEVIESNTYYRLIEIDGFGGEYICDHAFLRLDQDSVLYLRDEEGDEEKLFDYSLNIEDTVRYFDFSVHAGDIFYWDEIEINDSTLCVLQDISYLSLNGEDRIVWEVTGGRWVQSIGSDTWMWDVYQTLTGYTTDLLCAFLDGQELYHNPDFEFCDCVTDVNIDANEDKISIFPNPTNRDFILDVKNADLIGVSFLIFNSIGLEVQSGLIDFGKNEICLNGFPKGVYYLKVSNEVYKIVKD